MGAVSVLTKTVLFVPTVVLLISIGLGIFLRYRDSVLDELNRNVPLEEPVILDYTWEELGEKGFPMCYRPQIMRNVIKFPNDNACVEEDDCLEYMKERLLNFYGDEIIEVFPPNMQKDQYGHEIDSEPEYVKLKDYMLLDEYDQYKIDGLSRLGDHESYNKFLNFDQGNDINDFSKFANMGNNTYTYIGGQFFVSADIENGSPLHFAWGSNVFLMLSGKKRWLLIHPKYYDTCNCQMGSTGLFGSCRPKAFRPTDGNISIEAYKEILTTELKIPQEFIIDVTLNPGDILINCDVWLHAVENLHNNTIAMALRMAQPFKTRPFQTSTVGITLRSVYNSLITKWYYPERHTLIDGWSKKLLEEDPRYAGAAALNHKRTFSPLNHKRTFSPLNHKRTFSPLNHKSATWGSTP